MPRADPVEPAPRADPVEPDRRRAKARVSVRQLLALDAPRGRRTVKAVWDRLSQLVIVCAVFAGIVSATPDRPPFFPGGKPLAVTITVASVAALATALARTRLWPLYVVAFAAWSAVGAWPAVIVAAYYTAARARSRADALWFWLISTQLLALWAFAYPHIGRAHPGPSLRDLHHEALLLSFVLLGVPLAVGSAVAARRRRGQPRERRTAEAPPAAARLLGWLNRATDAVVPWALATVTMLGSTEPPSAPGFVVDAGLTQRAYAFALFTLAVLTMAAATLVRHRRWPLYLTGAVSGLWYVAWPPVMIASFYTANRERRAVVIGYAAIAVTATAAMPATGLARGNAGRSPVGLLLVGCAVAAVVVGLPMAVGAWARARREVMRYQAERVERLERERAAHVERARAQERTRIAREMHDVVAHRVALMVLHAGALEVSSTEPKTVEAARLIRGTGREALSELRSVLGVLRGRATADAAPPQSDLAPQPTIDDLERLLDCAKQAGLPVRRITTGTPVAVPATIGRTVYRVVQEALTNVIKHAGAAETTVRLRYRPDRLEIDVSNARAPSRRPGSDQPEPDLPTSGLPGSGLGLTGLSERVGLAGGQLRTEPRADGGFTVLASVPLDQAAREVA